MDIVENIYNCKQGYSIMDKVELKNKIKSVDQKVLENKSFSTFL
jgi:hypothetical protein